MRAALGVVNSFVEAIRRPRTGTIGVSLALLAAMIVIPAGATAGSNRPATVAKAQFAVSSVAEMKQDTTNLALLPAPADRAVPFHSEPFNQIAPPLNRSGSPLNLGAAGPASPAIGANSAAPALTGNFAGLGDNNHFIPPDTQGAAGPSHLMETLNDGVAIYDKGTGALVSNVTLQGFWSRLGTGSGQPANFVFDPRVQYDQYSGRFIVSSDGGGSTSNSWILIAVSATSDPTGSWYEWAISANDTDKSYWADFPALGIDSGHVYISANMYDNAGHYHQGDVWIIPKSPLLAGSATVSPVKETGVLSGLTQPAHEYGDSANGYFASDGWQDASGNLYLLVSQVSFDASDNPTWTDLGYIKVAPYGHSLPGAPQLGSANLIDTGDTRLQNLVLRNGHLWTTHTVASSGNTKTEAAWYELDPAAASYTTPGAPVQQGRVSDPTRFYYYPSIAVNANGDAAIGFSGSSSSDYASAYYTARSAADAPGSMPAVSLLKGGQAPYYKTFSGTENRWGDYSATAVDPSDDLGFWTLQEYAESPSGGNDLWGTWWGNVVVDVTPPTVTNVQPAGTINTASTTISADYSDSGSGIDASTAELTVNGGTVGACTATVTSISCPVTGLTQGNYTISGSVKDKAGNTATISGGFAVVDNNPPPSLTLSLDGSEWGSTANYMLNHLLVHMTVVNGPGTDANSVKILQSSYNAPGTVSIVGGTNDGGNSITPLDFTVGNVPANGMVPFTLVYDIGNLAGGSVFQTHIKANCQDALGATFSYGA